jgi:hypothetical protein
MRHCERPAASRFYRGCLFGLIGSIGLVFSQSSVAAEFDGPSFRKGMWRFVRTLDVTLHPTMKRQLMRQEATRCVDPTEAMKVTFSPATIGSCVSAKPEKESNTYVFAKRCDYMGPVRTVITVDSEDAYTEFNELIAGVLPKTDFVTARRISDCEDEGTKSREESSVGLKESSGSYLEKQRSAGVIR